jgi:hypothetical protein
MGLKIGTGVCGDHRGQPIERERERERERRLWRLETRGDRGPLSRLESTGHRESREPPQRP